MFITHAHDTITCYLLSSQFRKFIKWSTNTTWFNQSVYSRDKCKTSTK